MTSQPLPPLSFAALTLTGRVLILVVAFLGWFGAGVHMAITQQTGRSASIDLLERTGELDAERFLTMSKDKNLSDDDAQQLRTWDVETGRWFAWIQCAFLFGAATGGLLFGWLGDWFGRATGMALSILTYSLFAIPVYFVQTPLQYVIFWFLACLGVGGMWPNGVALVSEAWSNMSRPVTAGIIGTSANIGIFLLATLVKYVPITHDHWRWIMLVGAAPVVLGLFSLVAVPESPRWLATRRKTVPTGSSSPAVGEGAASQFSSPAESGASEKRVTTERHPTAEDVTSASVSERKSEARIAAPSSTADVFRPPMLWITLIGIILATTPVIGGWGTANWMIPWAEKAGTPNLKADVLQARALTGIIGSLIGGGVASLLGRRLTYWLVCVASLGIAQYTFWFVVPTDRWFLWWVAALGFFSGIYFGWLPLCLPELFPTRVRSTGAGVSFNFGRILTAVTVFATGMMMHLFGGDYARIGRLTSLIFVLGLVAILFAPDTSRKQLDD